MSFFEKIKKKFKWEPINCNSIDIINFMNNLVKDDTPIVKIMIRYNNTIHEVGLSSDYDGKYFDTSYYLDDKEYNSLEDFLNNAQLDGLQFSKLSDKIEVLSVDDVNPKYNFIL